MKKLFTLSLLVLLCGSLQAQPDVSVSQYMFNRYAINKAFGGSREALSLFGSFSKKWTGINGTPMTEYFSGHAPLKNEKIALGLDFFNQNFAVSQHTGFSASYTFRIKTGEKTWMGFALSGGGDFTSAKWSDVITIENGDDAFAANESTFYPIAGFGISMYSDKFFAGISIPSFFIDNEFEEGNINFDIGKISYVATAGYSFGLSPRWDIQPSFMAQYNGLMSEVYADFSATAIYNNLLWFGASYRTTSEIVALVGFSITPQFRFLYSFDYSLGDMRTYNGGTHEISIQYDFSFKIKTPNPRFF